MKSRTDIPDDVLPQRMREYRVGKNWTQQEMADRLGINRVTYIYYESGKRQPSYTFLYDFSKLSGWSADYLLGLSDIKQPVDKQNEAISQYENIVQHTARSLYELVLTLSGGD